MKQATSGSSSKIEWALAEYRASFREPLRLRPSEWASGRVAVQDGLTPRWQKENSPWLVDPLDTLADPEVIESVTLAPVGTGKTATMGEVATAYVVVEDPGPTLLVNQTEEDLKDWAETRLAHTLENTAETKDLYPSRRDKVTKTKIIFPRMPLFMTGANLSGLQAKSMRRVFFDEGWMAKKGLIKEAKGRLHDRWNRQFILMSQGGWVDGDLDIEWESTDKREFCWLCPNCDIRQPWPSWKDSKDLFMVDEVSRDGAVDQVATAKTARVKCRNPECSFTITDTPRLRRSLAESAIYVPTAEGEPGYVGHHYNTLCNWRKPLWELALERIKALEASKKGDIEPLRQLVQKRWAEAWNDELVETATEVLLSGYSRDEIDPKAKIDGEQARFATIDAGGDHFWLVIRAWKQGGGSSLLCEGYVPGLGGDEKELVKKLEEFGVEPAKTLLDLGYDWDRMINLCAKHGWLGIRGDGERQSWDHDRPNGTKVGKPFSKVRRERASCGKIVRYVFVATNVLKDMLARLSSGQGAEWNTFSDVSKAYKKHFKAEQQEEIAVGRQKQIKRVWVLQKRRANHLFDAEVYQVGAALMFRLFDE